MDTQATKRFMTAIGIVAAMFIAACLLFAVPQFAQAEFTDTSYPPSRHDLYQLDNGSKIAISSNEAGKAWITDNDGTSWTYIKIVALVESYDSNALVHYNYYENIDDALQIVVFDTSATIILVDNAQSAFDFTQAMNEFDKDGQYLNPFFVITNGYEIDFAQCIVPNGHSIIKACEQGALAVYTISAS